MKNTGLVRGELLRLAKQHKGVLKPAVVVKAAEVSTSPLHKCFEWDDTKAANNHRLWQARMLIQVTVEYNETVKDNVHTFVSLKSDRKESGYRLTATVLTDKEQREQMLKDAYDEMRSFEKKYKILSELTRVFRAINVVLKKA